MILYKYLVPERIDVLQKSLIRYTQPMLFNDPFESRPFFSFGSMEWIQENVDLEIKEGRMSNDEAAELIEAIEGLGFENYDELMRAMMLGVFGGFFGVLSLTEKPDNLLMWAHYSRNHEGFVIGFNSEHEYFAHPDKYDNDVREFGKVKYFTERPKREIVQLEGFDFHFTKSIEWEYEQEWRIIRPFYHRPKIYVSEMIKAEPSPIFLFAFPPSCVESVILGCRTSEKTKSIIRSILNEKTEYNHVKLYEAEIHKHDFRLGLKEAAT
jgi:hypothetical protein